jgi:hypothetical protein
VPKHSQLAIRIFSRLSCSDKLLRDAGGLSGTLSFRSMMEAAKNTMDPEKHMIAGNSTLTMHPIAQSMLSPPRRKQESLYFPLCP